ncbi:hypothetical protein O6H91_Y271900 [Diphasiastrum complanatum]|nr:hypothetical protein O6H91_Y271900 [Diphasiastrum complanatum]
MASFSLFCNSRLSGSTHIAAACSDYACTKPGKGMSSIQAGLRCSWNNERSSCGLSSHRAFWPCFHMKFLHGCVCPEPRAVSSTFMSFCFATSGLQTDEAMGLTLRELCADKVPPLLLDRAEELGFKHPTRVQLEALPLLLSERDCILHSQTGSGKTLTYLLPVLAKISPRRAAVQAIVVVPTRELGMQIARVARKLGGRGFELDLQKRKSSVSIMTLLDGGMSTRQKKWLKAEPPQLIVGTLGCICRMIETKNLKVNAVATIIVDEVDTSLHSATQKLLEKLLAVYTLPDQRQTIFASATIAQHHRFLQDCIQRKWAKVVLEGSTNFFLTTNLNFLQKLLKRA